MKNSISSIAFLKQGLLVLLLLAGMALAQGCATYQVRIPDDRAADLNYQGGTMHAFLWGALYSPRVMAAECQAEGINDVLIKRNFLHDMASVLTLGIWMPMEVNFRCEEARIDEEVIK